MVRKQIKKQFLNIKLTMLIVILFSALTTSVAYASNETVKKQVVTKKMVNVNENIINIEQLSKISENRKLQNNELFEKLTIKEEKSKNIKIGEININISEDTIKVKDNGYEENRKVKTLTRETDKYLAQKVEGITPKMEKMSTTAYCACSECCDKTDGITASGEKATEWYTIAAGDGYKFGTIIYIPELSDQPNGGWFIVQDRGMAISDEKLDIFLNDHEIAKVFGIHEFQIYIYEF